MRTHSLYKKWSFPLKTSLANVTKSAVSCGFGHNYWRNPQWKASFFVQLFSVRGIKIRTRYLAKSYVGVPIADRIGWKDGQLPVTGLWTLACPLRMPGFDTEGQIFKCWFAVKQSFSNFEWSEMIAFISFL